MCRKSMSIFVFKGKALLNSMSMSMAIQCLVCELFQQDMTIALLSTISWACDKVIYSRLSLICEHLDFSLVDFQNLFPLGRETEKKSICVYVKCLNQSWRGTPYSMYVVEKGFDLAFREVVCQTKGGEILSPVNQQNHLLYRTFFLTKVQSVDQIQFS